MQASERRRLGKSGVEVTIIGFGGAPLGNLFEALSDAQPRGPRCAPATTPASATSTPPRSMATASASIGSARRCAAGTATASCSRPRSVACSGRATPRRWSTGRSRTRCRSPSVYDYGYDGVMRSVEDSLQRLGMHRIDVLLIHDLDVWTHGSEAARRARFGEFMAGGYKAMVELREQGAVRAIGAGVNETARLPGLRRARRLRLLPARRALHAARAGARSTPSCRSAPSAASR